VSPAFFARGSLLLYNLTRLSPLFLNPTPGFSRVFKTVSSIRELLAPLSLASSSPRRVSNLGLLLCCCFSSFVLQSLQVLVSRLVGLRVATCLMVYDLPPPSGFFLHPSVPSAVRYRYTFSVYSRSGYGYSPTLGKSLVVCRGLRLSTPLVSRPPLF